MNDLVQQKTIDLARGLFVVKYNGADDKALPPIVRVFADRANAENCSVITAPDASDGTLYGPESALVVLVTRPSRLIVEVSPQRLGGSTAANVKIEPLTQGQRPVALPAAAPALFGADASKEISILAHVAGIGDVTEGLNTWIAGPSAPARIEGICLNWPNKPHDLDIRYAVKFARPQRGDNQLVPLGTFAGTRGRALPITGIGLEVLGSTAGLYSFSVEAVFLGAPVMRGSGQRINLTGPSGREPLVGIKITVEDLHIQPVKSAAAPAPASRSGSRVRVFRSRQSAGKSTG